MAMNRAALSAYNIWFEKSEQSSWNFPPHAQTLRAALLDFDCTVPAILSADNDAELASFEDNNFEGLPLTPGIVSRIKQDLAQAYRIRSEARFNHIGRDREREFEDLYGTHFFGPLHTASKVSDNHTRQTSRTAFYYDYFEHAKSRPWKLFQKGGDYRTDYPMLSEPRPDWVAYFPVYHASDIEGGRVPDTKQWPWSSTPKSAIFDNFSRTILERLCDHGLEPSTSRIFHAGKRKDTLLSDYLCFPWLIAEHKKAVEGNAEEYCYCQAANAGMATLMMYRTLSKYAKKMPRDTQIPPVTTITTVGEDVRVWVMYVSGNGAAYCMKCIWFGKMTSATHILRFKAILENCHTWAMRELRPLISTYIDFWKHENSVRIPLNLGDLPLSDLSSEALTSVTGALKLMDERSPDTDCDLDGEDENNAANTEKKIQMLLEEHGVLLQALPGILEKSIQAHLTPKKRTKPRIMKKSVSTQTDDSLGSVSQASQQTANGTQARRRKSTPVRLCETDTSSSSSDEEDPFLPSRNGNRFSQPSEHSLFPRKTRDKPLGISRALASHLDKRGMLSRSERVSVFGDQPTLAPYNARKDDASNSLEWVGPGIHTRSKSGRFRRKSGMKSASGEQLCRQSSNPSLEAYSGISRDFIYPSTELSTIRDGAGVKVRWKDSRYLRVKLPPSSVSYTKVMGCQSEDSGSREQSTEDKDTIASRTAAYNSLIRQTEQLRIPTPTKSSVKGLLEEMSESSKQLVEYAASAEQANIHKEDDCGGSPSPLPLCGNAVADMGSSPVVDTGCAEKAMVQESLKFSIPPAQNDHGFNGGTTAFESCAAKPAVFDFGQTSSRFGSTSPVP